MLTFDPPLPVDPVEVGDTDHIPHHNAIFAALSTLNEGKQDLPETPESITGEQGTDDSAILYALLTALDGLGLITDDTTTV